MMANKQPRSSQSGSRKVPMRVVALGLPRTSTDSLRSALLTLGFSRVYHGWTLAFEHSEDAYVWTELAQSKWNDTGKKQAPLDREAFDRVLGDYEAVTDTPGCYMAYELMKAYPQAKILLNTRDFDSWNASWQNTIVPVNKRWDLWLLSFVHPLWWAERNLYNKFFVQYFCGSYEFNTRTTYDTHHALVRQLAQEQKRDFLEWRAQDGWGPLCQFLGLPVPPQPFPSGNTGAEYEQRARQKSRNVANDLVRWAGLASGLGLVVGGALVLAARVLPKR